MKCPRCHRENTGKNKTCLYCGTPLRKEQKKPRSRLIAIPVAVCSASVVVIIVCSIMLLGDKSSKIKDQISLGYRALNEENYEQAEVCFRQALELGREDPSPEAQIGLAQALQRQEKPEEARTYLQQAQVNPTPIPETVVDIYNDVAEIVAIPTLTPAPVPGTVIDPTVQPPQESPAPVSPSVEDPDNHEMEPGTGGSTDTPAVPGSGSQFTGEPTVVPEGPTVTPAGPVLASGDDDNPLAVGETADEETKLLNWFETEYGGSSGADNGVPAVSVAKKLTNLNNDEHPELVVTKAEGSVLKAELHIVEDGDVTNKGVISSPQDFGSTITDKDYQGTQSCFVDESGVHILTNVIGEDDGTGSPQARTTLTTMTFGEGQDVYTTELEMINGNDPEPIAGTLEESETNPNAEWLRSMAGELSAENSDPEGDLSKVQNPIEGGVASVGVNEELLFISAYKAPGEEEPYVLTNESAGTPEPTEIPEGPGTGPQLEPITGEEPGTEEGVNPEEVTGEEPGTEEGVSLQEVTGEEPGTEEGVNPEEVTGEEPGTEEGVNPEEVTGEEPGTEEGVNLQEVTDEEPDTDILDPTVETEWETFTAGNTDMPGQTTDTTYTDGNMEQPVNPENAVQYPMQPENPENAGQISTDETLLLTQQAASFPTTFTQMTGDAGMADGVIGTQIVDIAGLKKLVVVSIKSGAMMFDLYAVQNGQVVKTGSGSGQGAFGNASDMYNASQVVFSTPAGIGIASAHTGRVDGNMCTVNFWTVDPTGNIVPNVNASWISGSDISAFQGQLAPAGLNGSWAASLEQDGASDPLSGGIGNFEPGTSDIAVVTAAGAAGNMTINAMPR